VFQIQQYVKELNSLESRRGRKPLDINNVVYWFKNARAAQKRAELRGVGPGEFPQGRLHMSFGHRFYMTRIASVFPAACLPFITLLCYLIRVGIAQLL
jgi:hypothetical protein